VPLPRRLGAQSAYVRKRSDHLIDTDNNAHDFTYQSLAVAHTQIIRFTSLPPSHATVDGRYRVRAVGGSSGKQVKFHISRHSTRHACKLVGADVVRFTGPGTCVVKATQLGNLAYYAARPVYQSIRVQRRRLAVDLQF